MLDLLNAIAVSLSAKLYTFTGGSADKPLTLFMVEKTLRDSRCVKLPYNSSTFAQIVGSTGMPACKFS